MGINIRQKGQNGERDVCKMLNEIIANVREDFNLPAFETRDEIFQRNQNQSAVGGSDLSNNLALEIEVKRQEQLSINTWWKQTLESANRTKGIPILIFKQSRQKWRVIMEGRIQLAPNQAINPENSYEARIEINIEDFKNWFRLYYIEYLRWQS